jgi:acetyl esterase
VLEVPAVDLTGSHPSFGELGTGYGLTKDDILECVSFYAPGADLTAPLLSPVFADLSGLPPALIATAEFDPLRDEGEAYARRLQDAGVDCTLKRFAGMLHGSMSLDALVPDVADEMGDDVAAFLRRVWAL